MTRDNPTRIAAGSRGKRLASFIGHYLAMVLAMLVGMVALHPVLQVLTATSDPGRLPVSLELDTAVMTIAMAVPMVAWMGWRGHSWRSAIEMTLAMYAGFAVLYPFAWADVLSRSEVEVFGHLLMLVFMAIAMLARAHHGCAGERDV